jgi:hypothetical protein
MDKFLWKSTTRWLVKDKRVNSFFGPYDSEEEAKEARRTQFNNSDHTEIIAMPPEDIDESTLEETNRYSKRPK